MSNKERLFGVKVKFDSSNREYTYLYDPEKYSIKRGDKIRVPVRGGSPKTVEVVKVKVPRKRLDTGIEYTIIKEDIPTLASVAKTRSTKKAAVADDQFITQARLLATRCGVDVSPNIMQWINSAGDRETRSGTMHVIREALNKKSIYTEEKVAFYKGLMEMAAGQERKDMYEDSLTHRMFG